mmetsp:Transcript_4022/g.11845  ORF Transcript_4022/g.11845 Transcript_4022/m.11845 type:complete len:607 (+) Transcript_4022:172-1992(+)
MASKRIVTVCGWSGCSYYARAKEMAKTLAVLYPADYEANLEEEATRDDYRAKLDVFRSKTPSDAKAQKHTSSPIVFLTEQGSTSFVGGCDDTIAWGRAQLSPSGVDAAAATVVPDGFAKDHGFDYDVVVIGGGSGGLACSKEMAKLGAKVAVLDFVKPSPAGSTWGLGGTCVNVGCIPKKLMHTASIIGETIKDDAAAFGWAVDQKAHDWTSMREKIQNYVKSLNFKYRVALREAGISYLNKLGEFVGKNTLKLTDKKGKTSEITAARFVVAVGGRPNRLQIPGGEHAVDSDDVFSLEKAPGRVLCVGAGYIALECGGFTAGLGYPTTCMVRSILLRGFDRECVGKIQTHLEHHGVSLQVGVTPTKIEKDPATGVLTVHGSDGSANQYDTVLVATGRKADTTGLGLSTVPGAAEDVVASGKVACVDEQLPHAPHVYAVGDVIDGRPELTPVAIEAGLRLARRLFGGASERMDYENVATTVFTPLEYGAIGLSEDDAIEALGKDNVESYISEFAPLEYALSDARAERGDGSYAKLVCDKTKDLKVVGFHYLGPNAGEVTQGFSVAMRKGATYSDFLSTVGIHPTIAEEFTGLTVTKSSGESAAKGGC